MSRPEKRNTRSLLSPRTKKVLDTRLKLAKETELMMKNKASQAQGANNTAQAENIIEEDPDIIF
jgi:hypothetical protein